MAIYRNAAEKLVDVYDFDWQDNLKMKEACVCSVESVIANGVNISIVVLLATVSGLWREIAIYFFTFAAMRFYAGGAHAKNYRQCITIYLTVMMSCIVCAKYILPLNGGVLFAICLGSVLISGLINGKYAARQQCVGTRSNLFHKRAMLMHRIVTIVMLSLFVAQLQTENMFLAELLAIQSFALLAQSVALLIEGKEEVQLSE